MARTIGDLRTESLLGFSSTVYGSYADNWLKDAADEIIQRAGGGGEAAEILCTYLAGASSAAVSTEFHFFYPYGVRQVDANGVTLGVLEQLDYAELVKLPASSNSVIQYWAYADDSVFVWPTPSTTVYVKAMVSESATTGSTWSNTLALGTGSGLLEDWFADTMVCYVRAKLFRYEDDFQMAGQWEQQYERNLSKVANEYTRRYHSTPHQVPGMWQPRSPNSRWL